MQLKLKNILIMLPVIGTLIGSLTVIMTFVNLSPSQHFLNTWLTSFLFAFMVLLPLGGLIFAGVNKLVHRYFVDGSVIQKNLLLGTLMAIVMESIMAFVTTVNNHGFINIYHFLDIYITSFLFALPVGLAFACLMTLVIKPRIERFLATEKNLTGDNYGA